MTVAYFVEEERHRKRVPSRDAAAAAQQAENNALHACAAICTSEWSQEAATEV